MGSTPVQEAAPAVPAENLADVTPERIFKVVFVGDSGVGKTCFLHRFCHDRFKASFAATIGLPFPYPPALLSPYQRGWLDAGVDFQVKTMRVEGHVIALQVWDTAGQERFRSITKQYFRKADGVIVMFDVTSEQSFLNIRNWMLSVRVCPFRCQGQMLVIQVLADFQEGVDKDCVLAMVANKIDLAASEEERAVSGAEARKLADEYAMLCFEASAATGSGVNEAMQQMAM